MIKAGSRDSRLALLQVDEIETLLKKNKGIALKFARKAYRTTGDKDKTTSLVANTADDFFTDTLDQAVLGREIDVAIHSAKDLPQKIGDGLEIFALTQSPDETDAFVGKTTFDHLPRGARVATSSLLRQQEARRLRPDIKTVDIRGTLEERIQKMEEGRCDGLIVAAVALKRLGLQKYIQNIMPWEGTPLQGQLAVVGRKGDTFLKKLFACIDVRRTYGRVTLVGAGPGDPELITLKGIRALRDADCVFYDYLIPKEILDYAKKAEKIYVGKRKGAHTMPQEELNRRLRQKAVEGRRVVRLKGGDPLVFGRGADEISYLRSYHIEVAVIPGVSSATGVPSYLGIPLTARQTASSVAFVSGYAHGEKGTERRPLHIPRADTLVFLMGLTKLNQIVQSLSAAKWPSNTPVIVISKGTCPDEKIISASLKDIRRKVHKECLPPPALIVAGETVRFWQENRPWRARGFAPRRASLQAGRPRRQRILYTGTNPAKFKALGDILPFPMIQISPAKLTKAEKKRLLTNLPRYDIILFTSRFAVKYFFEILKEGHYPLQRLREKTFAAIGRETAHALGEQRIRKILTASEETSQGLFKAMLKRVNLQGKRILFPRSSLPNPYLKERLTAQGSRVEELTIYRNTKPAKRPLPKEDIGQVLFTSPSTARNFLKDYGAIPRKWRILSRGPKTSEYLKKRGYSSFQGVNLQPRDKENL